MGKRTNTILQSAFFKLADIMPIDEAVDYMKQAAKKSYGKKGDARCPDELQGYRRRQWTPSTRSEVPESWHNPAPDAPAKELKGPEALVKMVRNVMEPVARMDGDSLPVSAFAKNPNGEWELGASAYEKRGTAVMVPAGIPTSASSATSAPSSALMRRSARSA